MKSQRYLPTCKVWKGTHLGGLKSRALPIYMARQTGGLTVCKWKQNPYMVNFVPESCIICTNEIHLPKRGVCKSWKQVSKMSIEQIEGEFPFGTFCLEKQDYMYLFWMFCCFWKMYISSNQTGINVSKWKGHCSISPSTYPTPHWKHEHVAQ